MKEESKGPKLAEQKPMTLLENLESTKGKLVAKMGLLDAAIEMVKQNPAVTSFNEVMAEFQKLRA